MKKVEFPQVGDIAYLIHEAVIITEILEAFRIVKVCYLHSGNEFYTDVSAIFSSPDLGTNTLSINLFVEV